MISNKDFRAVKLVLSDIDGVLTDCTVGYGMPDFIKFFNYRDGHWIKMGMRTGLLVGLLSGRSSNANRARAAELGLTFCREDVHDKRAEFLKILEEYHLRPEECLYIGDDIVDYPVLKMAGIGVTPADGIPELDEVVQWRTGARGGEGVLCEVMRRLMLEQGTLDSVLERYRK